MSGTIIARRPRSSPAPAAWRDRLWSLRDRLLMDARFQRWAATFPLTRPIARRQASAAFDLCAGFVYSQILAACLELDLLRKLAVAPQTTAALAAQSSLTPVAMERLLAAAAALKLVAPRGSGRWGLGMTGAAISGTPGLAEMVRHHALLYADLADPVALLRRERGATTLAAYWPYATAADPAALPSKTVAPYSQLMTASQAMIGRDIVDAYPFGHHKKLLDVGGGEGAFARAVADASTLAQLAVFDLPAVVARARDLTSAAAQQNRIECLGGDFLRDPLPAGADLITLVRVLHDHDDDAAMTLLHNVRRALPPGGRVLVAEPMSATPGAEAMGDAYFGFYLLAMGRGRPRTAEALQAMLVQAGFSRPKLWPTARPMLVRVLTADA